MIVITLQQALLIYSAIIFAGAVAVWLWTEVGGRQRQRELAAQHRWRCVFCGFLYLDDTGEQLSVCPQCGNMNTAEDRKAKEIPLAPVPHEKADAAHAPEKPRRNPSRRKRRGR